MVCATAEEGESVVLDQEEFYQFQVPKIVFLEFVKIIKDNHFVVKTVNLEFALHLMDRGIVVTIQEGEVILV